MSKMIKFKGVLDGFRSAQPPKAEEEVIETLKPDNFQIAKVFCDNIHYFESIYSVIYVYLHQR